MPNLSLKKISGFFLAILLTLSLTAQKKASVHNYPDRYRLDIPKEWKKPRLILAITEMLPATIDELKNRDFCTECKTPYCVHLTIDSISIENSQTSAPIESGLHSSSTFSFTYHFYAALTVFDSLERTVARLRLVSTEESFDYTKQYSGTSAENVTYTQQNVYDTSGRVIGSQRVEDARAFTTSVPNHSPWEVLTTPFLMDICEQKVYAIRKLLKQVK